MLESWPPFKELAKRFAEGEVCLRVAGLTGAARALVVAELFDPPRAALVVASGLSEAHRWAQDLKFFGAPVVEFPEPEPRLWRGGHHREADAERALISRRLLAGEALLVVATPTALDTSLPRPDAFAGEILRITVGDSLDRELLFETLERGGYERVDTVVEVGQWSVRGGIVDVFSPAHAGPVRIEFFGDDVESMRLFDPTSQRSVDALPELLLLPFGGAGDGTLLDYLPASAAAVVESLTLLDRAPADASGGRGDARGGAADAPAAPSLAERLRGRQLLLMTLVAGTGPSPRQEREGDAGGGGGAPLAARLSAREAARPGELLLDTRSLPRSTGNFNHVAAEIAGWRREGFTIRLVANDERQAEHLQEIFRDHGLEALHAERLDASAPLAIVVGDCSAGFAIPELGVILLTEQEVFGARRRTLRRPKYQRGAAISAFTDLQIGDLVVHEDHGIGKYLGLRTMPAGDRTADFLLLEYADANQLYLPVDRLDLISKYLGGDAAGARLDRLGGASWQRVKESVRAALREMAEDLLKLYAQRSLADRKPFSPDTPWQREFEAAFRFEETPDQLRAIDDVKRDLQSVRPMDRLVAGDVGYGKTEVALRGAFKAVAEGRQVAVLVPTTVLAHQHWTTFTERFAPFPAKVELLSRFRSTKEQKAVVEGLKNGTVDVVIGTHRLLSKDVGFKDLGLLVVDEEHRFGVASKERMKQLRTSVDVLAMTATPIPRTLYMSLSGVRDMSVIETAPLDRLPVETLVRRFNKGVVKDAIERELERGGQIFFVHNRVQSLASMAHLIQGLVPDARVVMAHGQMRERELEAAMVKFVTGQADILVSTAIVESGLDIPASNTIIINRADRFGLAQLYQLRGRVGRERQQGYAYLLVPADGRVDEQAQRRLRVLQELTELGSGFKLALRDLEIRGAGNLLGPEQHGHIAAVGYDLYSKLLAEAVRELDGSATAVAPEPVISVEVEGFLPEEYVPEVNQRLALYKRLTAVATIDGLADLGAELTDRFGPLPPEAAQLLDIVGLRVQARTLGIEKIEAGGGRALVTFSPATTVDADRLIRTIQTSRGRLKMKREYTLEATITKGAWPEVRNALRALLGELSAR